MFRIASLVCLVVVCGSVCAQTSIPYAAAADSGAEQFASGNTEAARSTAPGIRPEQLGSGPFADGKVLQAVGSETVASRILRKTSFESTGDQIKFEIQILSVDSETRDRIYEELGNEKVQTQITKVGNSSSAVESDPDAPGLSSQHLITTSSVVSTAVVDQDTVEHLYALAKESDASMVISRPRIIAADGQLAGFQQQVQRPFLADLQEVKHGSETAIQSAIQVLNEGTDLAVKGDVDGDSLQIQATIRHSKVTDVQQHNVYGLGEGQNIIQVPSHEVRIATATGRLMPKQTMLLDPYYQSKVTRSTTRSTPLLENIPYVGDTFSQTEIDEVTLHTIVLLKAQKL